MSFHARSRSMPHRPRLRASAMAVGLALGLLTAPGAQALNVVWNGGTGAWTDAASWSSGLYPSSTGDYVYIDGGAITNSAVTLNTSVNIGRLTIDAGDRLTVVTGGSLDLYGGQLENNGLLALNASASGQAMMHVAQNLLLTGAGTTALQSDASGYRAIVAGSGANRTLTIAAGHTMRGAGDLGHSSYGALKVINQGTVIAEGGTLGNYGGFDNSAGLVQVADGATLAVNGSSFTGGAILSLGAASLSGSSFSGVVLSGNFTVANSLYLINSRIANQLLATGGNGMSAAGTLTVDGQLKIAANSSGHTVMGLTSDTTLAGSGTTVLSSDASGYRGIIASSSRTLTIASGHTLRGAGELGSTTYGMVKVANQGTVIAEGGTLGAYGGFDNSAGLVQVADGATLAMNGSGFTGGTIQSLGAALLGGSSFANVALGGDFTVASGLTLLNSRIDGTLRVNGGTGLNASGTLTVNGQLKLAASPSGQAVMSLTADTTLAGTGTTVLAGDASGYRAIIASGSRTLTVGAGHTVRGAGDLGSTSYGMVKVVNQGTIIAEGGTLGSYGGFDNSAGLVQVADGAMLSVNGSSFSGGTVKSLGLASLTGNYFTNVTLTGNFKATGGTTLGSSRIVDTLSVAGGASLSTSGVLTVDGQLALAGSSIGMGVMNLTADTTLAGSGETVLSRDASGYMGLIAGGSRVLTIAAGHTVRGAGDLGNGSYGALNVANRGTVIAQSGTLSLTPGSLGFDNTGGLVQVAGDGLLSLSGNLLGGTVQGLASTSRLSGNTFRDLTLTGTLAIASGTSASFAGAIANQGTLALAGTPTGYSILSLSADTTLSGTGSVILSRDASGYAGMIVGGKTLTIGTGQTVRGAGELGNASYGALAVVNQGTVIAEGGTLNLYPGSGKRFDNTAGLVQIADGATLGLGGDFVGGTLQGLGAGGRISGGTLKDVTLAGQLAISAGSSASISGGIVNNAKLTLTGAPSGFSILSLSADTTLSGTGSVVLSRDASSYAGMIVGNKTLTIGVSQTVRGAGELGNASYGALAVVNQGTVIAEGGTLNLYPGSGKRFDNTAGLVKVADGALLGLGGDFVGGTLQGLGAGSRISGSTLKDVTLAGQLAVAGGNSVSISGSVVNNATLTLAGTSSGYSLLSLSADTTLSGTGSVILSRDASSYAGMIVGNKTLTIASGQTVLGAGALGNASYGALGVVNHGTVVAVGGELASYAGALGFDNRDGSLAIAAGAALSFASTPLFGDASQLRIGVTGSSGHAVVGQLSVLGNAGFDGQVQLDLANYIAAIGDSFSFASYSGTTSTAFDAVTAAGYTLSVSYANHLVTATITGVSAVPEPGGWAMLLGGLGAIAYLARRRQTR